MPFAITVNLSALFLTYHMSSLKPRLKKHHHKIELAETLDKKFYQSAEWFERSKEKLFANSWQFIGDTGMIAGEHNLYPFTLLSGFLNEPLLISKSENGELTCLSNVCTHRGNLLITEPCKNDKIRCRYHGRIFDCNGKFQSMPEFKEVKNFPSKSDSLPKAKLHQWMNLLFVSLTGKMKAKEVFAPLEKYLSFLNDYPMRFFSSLSRDYELEAHWALYCENYLEGFHIPFVHPGLNKIIDYGSYTTQTFRYCILQTGFAKEDAIAFRLPESHPDYGKKVAAYYFFLFPNLMLNFYPWGLSVNIVRPLAPEKTVINYLTYIFDEKQAEQALMLDRVEMEDEEVVLRVQRGIHSRFYSHGRYSVTREQGVHHFHHLISSMLS
jgi:choline monooxygenase